jgi:glycine cleavage system H protein
MKIPANLKYATSHEWVKIEDGTAFVGITDFAQTQLGDVTYVGLPAVGSKLSKGQEMGTVESIKAASELYSPVSGEVIAVNAELESAPEHINTSPYEKGWMIKVKLSGVPEGLLSADEYQKLL